MEWTPEELAEFDQSCAKQDSRDQMTRIEGRLEVRGLIERHGKEKCDAMFVELTKPRKKTNAKSVDTSSC